MADLKISALNSLAGADLVAADVVAVVDDSASETKKLTVSDLIANGTTLISDATIPSAKILFSAGSIATASVADAGITTAKVASDAITAAKLADNSSVTLVSTLPGSGDFVGQLALDTDDNKVYAYNGSSWVSVKGAGSINVVSGSTSGIVNITTSTSGDTVTVSTTLDDTTAAAQFLAGPTGSAGTVGYRALVGTDLPTATTTAKGGIIVNGEGLRMDSDTIEIDNDITANSSTFQAVKFDSKGLITSGRDITSADLPDATDGATGAVKPGTGLEMGTAGAIDHSNSVAAATNTKITYDAQGHVTAGTTLAASDIPDLDTAKITTGSFATARIADDAITAAKLGDRSTATIAETTPAGGAFIGQCHLNSITGDYFLWDGNVWQPIGISVGEIVLAGTYDASTNLVATVTSEGTAVGFTVGSALPAASSSNKSHYVIVSEAGTGTSPAPTVALNPPDFLLSTGTVYTEIDVSDTVTAQQASNVSFTAAGNIVATNVQSAIEELDSEKVATANPTLTGTVTLGEDAVITFEGATDNAFETTLTVVDPTADRSLSLPNISGTLISSGDTGTVTSTMILDGTIANADISSSAEIAVSKLANGTARQLLQTDSGGTGVEFTSNVDVPGSFDCTGAGTFDSTLTVTGLISADGRVSFPAGSASAPSFYFGTDTNTGLYHPAADAVAITTGGTQRVVVNSSGQVGINTSTPTQPLTVNGVARFENFIEFGGSISTPATAASIYRPADNTLAFGIASVERLRINSSGNVGIGTSAPGRNLVVNGGSSEGVLQITNNTSGTSVANGLEILCFTTGEAQFLNRENADMRFDTNNTERVRISSSGDVNVGPINISSSTGYGAQVDMAANAATIKAQCQGTASSFTLLYEAYKGTSRNFYVNAAGAAYFQGSVGIGTSSTSSYNAAADNLVIYDSGNAGITIRSGTSSDGAIYFNDTDDANQRGIIRYVHANDALAFHTSAGESLRIDSSGRVGIGVTPPDYGSGRVSLDLHSSGATVTHLALTNSTTGSSGASNGFNIIQNGLNTLMYLRESGFMSFSTANTERLRIDSSGRLLLGTSSHSSIDNFVVEGHATDGTNAAFMMLRRGSANPSGGLGYVRFADSNSGVGAQIHAETDGTWASNDYPTSLRFSTTADGGSSPSERLRIDSSGNVIIGTTTAASNSQLTVRAASPQLALYATPGNDSRLNMGDTDDHDIGMIAYANSDNSMRFTTNASERMRLDSGGMASMLGTSTNGALNVFSSQGASTSANLILGQHSASSITSGTLSFLVYTNGNVVNTNNSYGSLSDAKLKENIVDASSQWDDIKDLRVRNYNFIEGQTHTQIGVVAQEVETVSPGLVTESPDRDEEGNDLGTTTKSVNYSVLYMKAVKALQEAMDRIETLEAKVAALEAE